MKKPGNRPGKRGGATATLVQAPSGPRPWHYGLAFAIAAAAVLVVYAPALNGPFVLDDLYLPFMSTGFAHASAIHWMRGVRPLLMLSFWLNFMVSGTEPFSYHLGNVLLHLVTGGLVFLSLRKLLERGGETDDARRSGLAAFAAGLFLLHPLQTESVSYVASRSEVLSVVFFYAAFTVFLYRRAEAIRWPEAVTVLALFAAAVTTKEHAAVLPALLLLTDYYWNPGFSFRGIARNWRLYGLVLAGAALALRMVWRVIHHSNSAGFSIREFTWNEYFYTQCRAVWHYVRLFVLPYGQNIDPDFPASRTILEHGAVVGLAALVALVAAAVYFRRRFPLASYGVLVFLLLLAPTSSFVPLADAVAEHRMYLPFLGLLLVAADFLRRWRTSPRTLTAILVGVLLVAGVLTYNRNQLWASDLSLWEDTVSKSPQKWRPHFQVAFAYYTHGRCQEALQHYEAASRLGVPDYRVVLDWALAYMCLGDNETALAKLHEAAGLSNTGHTHALMGLLHMKQGRQEESLRELAEAERLNPGFESTYDYRAELYASQGDLEAAAKEYRRALSINPDSVPARDGLAMLEQRRRSGR